VGEFCHKKSFFDEDNDSAIPQVSRVENRNLEAIGGNYREYDRP
jgi:hypothetical protein